MYGAVMKIPFPKLALALSVAAGIPSTHAADLIKADNSLNLKTAGTYAAPNDTVTNPSGSRIIFNNVFANTTASVNTAGISADSIVILDPGHAVTLSTGGTLTVGSLDLSEATQNLTISGSFATRMSGTTPSVTVKSGITLTINTAFYSNTNGGGTINITGDGTTNINGAITDGDAVKISRITKSGNGILTSTGSNTYTGQTTVSSGTLLINGSHTVSSGTTSATAYNVTGGILGGTGTINLSAVNSGVTLGSGAKLTAGGSGGASVESLTFALGTGSLDAKAAVGGANTGAFIFELGSNITPGSTYDQIIMTSGTLDIGTGLLEATDFDFTTLAGFGSGVYVLFDTASTISGTLGANTSVDLGNGYTGTLSLSDSNTNLILTVVPEPQTATLLCLALGMTFVFVARRRRRQS
ncbi:PEP-CTERM protein-sorting domain-containing protein [Terrimicrobium sacchariphilum]|uniref:PEP-CTERM protein-sorting domain-containing protein n=2 Tax=Terrimicrobium sacchariphilum TaxID=690879 RepID=A0A146G7I2_TERSA|nr:PEP-CTERM protein-sorting domain-containing protein [Terrimicrobium sacchariphilum]